MFFVPAHKAATEASSNPGKIDTTSCSDRKLRVWMFPVIKAFFMLNFFYFYFFWERFLGGFRNASWCFLMCSSVAREALVGISVTTDRRIPSYSVWGLQTCFGIFLSWLWGAKATDLTVNSSNCCCTGWLLCSPPFPHRNPDGLADR